MRDTLPTPSCQCLAGMALYGLWRKTLRLTQWQCAPLDQFITRRSGPEEEDAPPTVLPPLTIRSVANICEKHLGHLKSSRHPPTLGARTMEDGGSER